jgi:hypothetical protein
VSDVWGKLQLEVEKLVAHVVWESSANAETPVALVRLRTARV